MTLDDATIAGIALTLYTYNVRPEERARKLYDAFGGDCYEVDEIIEKFLLKDRGAFIMSDLPIAMAKAYMQHALERYEVQARHRLSFLGEVYLL